MIAEISKQLINEIMNPYKQGCKVLRKAFLDYPIIRGTFLIGQTYYHVPAFEHATDIEIQLCLNQLIYTGVAEITRQKIIPELEGLDFEELRRENMLIIESRKRFVRPIRTDIEISGEIVVKNYKSANGLLIAQTNFQFENKSCFGSLELALIKPGVTKIDS
jgi:hypothetical protein